MTISFILLSSEKRSSISLKNTKDDEDINLTLLTIYDKSERSTISDKEIKDLLKSI